MTSFLSGADNKLTFLSHWILVTGILLAVVALTLHQADDYPPSIDEFASMIYAGWLEGDDSPVELLRSFSERSVASTPGYYVLLSIWGRLTTYDIALARILGILAYLLVLSLFYRIAADFIDPRAGPLALVIAISIAFANYYVAHARSYMILALLSAITTWLYLRILYRSAKLKSMDLFALGAAVFALVMTHLFSATLLATLGLYHLLIAPKNRRWLIVASIVSVSVVLSLPMIVRALSSFDTAYSHLDGPGLNALDAIYTWLTLFLNGQTIPLVLLCSIGVFIGIRKGLLSHMPWLALLPLFLVVLAFASDLASLVRTQSIRHQMDGFHLIVLIAAAGHYALYRWKAWLGALVFVWIGAGLLFQQSTDWWRYTGYRSVVFGQAPIHILSRLAVAVEPKP